MPKENRIQSSTSIDASPSRGDSPLESVERARYLLACGLAGGDVSENGIARFSGATPAEARIALTICAETGLVDEHGSVDKATAIALVDVLPPELVATIRGRAARAWMNVGPEHFLAEVERFRTFENLGPNEDIVDLADQAGRMSLSLHDYSTAASLLRLAMDFDISTEPVTMARRLCNLATALDGLGNVSEAREILARAASLGELAGDGALVAAAAVQYALPADWYAGDTRASALLDRAASMNLSEPDDVRVLAARSLVEMRIPISPSSDQQLAWVSRPQVAHSLAEEALQRSTSCSPDVRSLASLAWRSTHRSPQELDKRREISRESLNLAQMLRLPSHQVESAIWLAVDAIESADRPLFDEALSVTRWVAERDGNPRLIWRAHTLSCGAAHMESDLEQAEHWRHMAREVGMSVEAPGWLAADLLLKAEAIVSRGDEEAYLENLLPEDFPALINPIGRAAAALPHAVVGNKEIAERMVRKSLRQLDPESSFLLLATRCAHVVLTLENEELIQFVLNVLKPWAGHVAVDSNGWWIDGPVDLWLAALWGALGDQTMARMSLDAADSIVRAMDDVRSLTRLEEVRTKLTTDHDFTDPPTPDPEGTLTERQTAILKLMSQGLTNRQIAERMSFSVSTIRVDTISIYRSLGVKGRAEAIAWFTRNHARG